MGVRLVNPETLVRPVGYSHAAIGEGRAVVLAGQIGCDQSGKVEAPAVTCILLDSSSSSKR